MDGTKQLDQESVLRVSEVVIVTGPSGAGRSTAIHALEDFGFEAIDNMPLSLVPRLFSGPPTERPIVIGVDARTRDFSTERLWATIDEVSGDPNTDLTLVYIDCGTETLIRRYSETRRRHPLSENGTLLSGIEKEHALLEGLKERADVLVDTTHFSPHDLRAELARWFSKETRSGLSLSVQSFSYKRGTPRGIDMVVDCRFLRNPHWVPDLRGMTGLDPQVAAYVTDDSHFEAFFDRLVDFVLPLLPAYRDEGKAYFSIGLGCTGGQHRSVFVAEALAKRLAEQEWQVSIRHRELERRHGEDRPNQAGLP